MTSSISSLITGYNTGVIGTTLLFIKPELHPPPLLVGALVTSSTLGAILGALLSPKQLEKGRVGTLRNSAVLFLSSSLACLLAPTIRALIVSRFVAGIAMGLTSAAVPLYIAETSLKEKRGAYATVPQFMISSGILLSFIVSCLILHVIGPNWRLMLGFAALPSAVQLLLMLNKKTLPESPRFLLANGQVSAAQSSLEILRPATTASKIKQEREQIAESLAATPTAGAHAKSLTSLLTTPLPRARLLICMFLQAFQQLAGINAIVYFTPLILQEAGVASLLSRWVADANKASLLSTILAYLPKIPALLLASNLMDKCGRRSLLLYFTPVMSASLAVLAASLQLLPAGSQLRGVLGVLSIMTYGVVFSCSLGPIPNILSSELFPTEYRSVGMSTSVGFQWFFNALVSLSFPVLQAKYGTERLLWFFSGMCAATWLFAKKYVPETKGKSLEEIGGGG